VGHEVTWITVTDPQGEPVYLSTDGICRVRKQTGDQDRRAKSTIDLLGGQTQAATETRDQVMALLNGATKE
jgi:hypothetical protein